jgi:hypothetical protein
MPDETTFELASVQFGAEPVAVFRFGYEPLRTARTAWSWKPGTRHCFGRRGRGQRLCEMVARSVSLCAAGSRWRGRRTSPSLAARHERAHGASRPLPRIPAKVSSPSDSRRSASAVGTALHAPKLPLLKARLDRFRWSNADYHSFAARRESSPPQHPGLACASCAEVTPGLGRSRRVTPSAPTQNSQQPEAGTDNSTRRFCARPCGVSFEATGPAFLIGGKIRARRCRRPDPSAPRSARSADPCEYPGVARNQATVLAHQRRRLQPHSLMLAAI